MKINNNFKYFIIILIFFLFLSNSLSVIAQNSSSNVDSKRDFFKQFDQIKFAEVNCFASGPDNSLLQIKKNLSSEDIKILFQKLSDLNFLISQKSSKEDIEKVQNEIIDLAKNYNLLPKNYEIPKNQFYSDLAPEMKNKNIQNKIGTLDFWRFQFICNFISLGSGSTGPFFVFPRLVPILLFPIPRLLITWSADEGFTSCGGLLRMLGFVAIGEQRGIALGFWGIGFSVFLPPVSAYGVFGYTGLVATTAEDFIGYPFPLLFYLFWL
jgi:hypothetical protein